MELILDPLPIFTQIVGFRSIDLGPESVRKVVDSAIDDLKCIGWWFR